MDPENTTCFGIPISIARGMVSNDTTSEIIALSVVNGAAILFVLAILILDIYYLLKYKTSFILRLFFYLTVCAFISIMANLALSLVIVAYREDLDLISSCVLISLAGILFSGFRITGIFFILCMVLILLSKMYRYVFKQNLNLLTKVNPRQGWKEAVFVFFLVVIGILLGVPFIFLLPLFTAYTILLIVITFFLGTVCLVLLIIWVHRLRKIDLLRAKSREVQEIVFFYVGDMFLLGLVGLVIMPFLILQLDTIVPRSIFGVINPFADVSMCLPFLFHVCSNLRKAKRMKHVVKEYVSIDQPSLSPSNVGSFYSRDAVENSINFLSPSTDSPTEQTGLID